MRKGRILSTLTPLLLVGALATACGTDSEVSAAEQRVCDANDRLNEALRNFNAEGENRAAARDELFDAMAEMSHATSELGQAENSAGNNPIHDLNEELQDTPDDATVAEIAEGMAVAGGNFLQGVKDFVTGREC